MRPLKSFFLTATFFVIIGLAIPAHAAIQPVSSERIFHTLPQGMQAGVSQTSGKISIQVDSKGTDWGQALLYSGSSTHVMLHIGIHPPAGATTVINAIGNTGDEALLDDIRIQEANGHYMAASGLISGFDVAEYSPSRSIVTPWLYYGDFDTIVRWYDDANQPLLTEKMSIAITQTISRSFYAVLPLVSQADIQANAENLPYIEAQKSHGEVIYTLTQAQAANNPNPNIQTLVKAPAGATQCNQYSVQEGNRPLPINNGSIQMDTWYRNGNELLTGTSQKDYSLEWLDASDNVVDCTHLSIRLINQMEIEPWPHYVSGWSPVPSNRLSYSQSAAAAGVDVSYQKGSLHYKYTGHLPDAEKLDAASISISVTPPQGVASYKLQVFGNCQSLGKQPNTKQQCDQLIQLMEPAIPYQNQAGPIVSDLFRRFETDDDLTVYFSADFGTSQDGNGMLYIFYWYRDMAATDLPSVEYYYETADAFVQVVETSAVGSEGNVPENIKEPIVVGHPNWKLVIEHYPQRGHKARHYELHLRDEWGNIVIPQRDVVIYLPYPQGFSFLHPNATYALKHYDLEMENYGRITITPTAKGLRFVTSSLSPFVVSWDEQPSVSPTPTSRSPVSPPPRTGDRFPMEIVACIAACMLAAAGLLAYRLKRHS